MKQLQIFRRHIFTFLAVIFLFSLCAIPATARGTSSLPVIMAESAILVDAATGTVLYEKNAHTSRPIASTTKIMTALLTIENCKNGEITTVSRRATEIQPSRLDLKPGEQIGVDELLQAILIKSANDAALTLAEHVGGSVEGFADMMNTRARELGATETNFCNPHGLYNPKHYSSAYDLSLMAREAMKHPIFRQLVDTETCSFQRPDGTVLDVENHNRLLFQDPSCDGIKTGFIRQSGRCVVVSAKRNGWRLIAVVLNSSDLWGDAKSLLNHGYRNWDVVVYTDTAKSLRDVRVIGGRTGRIAAMPKDDLVEVLPKGDKPRLTAKIKTQLLFAPVKAGAIIGHVRLFADGKETASTSLVAASGSKRTLWFAAFQFIGRIILYLFICVCVIKIYVKTTKAARRRRNRLQAQSRTIYPWRASQRRRPDYYPTRSESRPGQE